MEKDQFIEHFAVTFMATWAATKYTDYCMAGQQKRLNEPPVEDAYFLAEKAWEHKNKVTTYIPEDY